MASSEVRLRIVGTRVDASDIVSGPPAFLLSLWPRLGMVLEARRGAWLLGWCRWLCRPPPAPPAVLSPPCPAALTAAALAFLSCALQFAVGTIKEDYLGVISAPM